MSEREIRRPESLHGDMLAPCGINCGVCSRAFRTKDRCPGCTSADPVKPKYCAVCRIRNCDEIAVHGRRFCFECPTYPCARLRRLDARYCAKYRTSLLENLEGLRRSGIERFVALERQRWMCEGCGALTCIHKDACVYCGKPR